MVALFIYLISIIAIPLSGIIQVPD